MYSKTLEETETHLKKSTDLPRDGGHLVEDTVLEHKPYCQYIFSWVLDFPGGCVKESASKHRRCGFDPWIRKIPWRRKWKPTPVFLPGKSHEQRSLMGYSPWAHKESDTQFSSVTQSCPTLCDSMDHSMPGFPVHHQLLELTQSMSMDLVLPLNHLILCHPLLLLSSIFPIIRVFSNESLT